MYDRRPTAGTHRAGRRRAPWLRALEAVLAMVLLVFGLGFYLGASFARATVDMPEAATAEEAGSNIPEDIELPSFISEELLSVNPYSRPGEHLERVNAIVIHYVGNPGTTAEQNRSYFQGLADSGATSASSNLIVGLEGEVVLCVPLDEVAYCSNRRNSDTISIEFCHPDETGQPSPETYDALIRLSAWLCELYGLDPAEDVIRHYDVIGKGCPLYYVNNEDAWAQFKKDVKKEMK